MIHPRAREALGDIYIEAVTGGLIQCAFDFWYFQLMVGLTGQNTTSVWQTLDRTHA